MRIALPLIGILATAAFATPSLEAPPAPQQLHVAWIDSSTLRVETEGGLPTTIDELWWPDGRRCHSRPGCTGGSFGAPAWSPDGARLAYWIYGSPRGRVLDVNDLSGRPYDETLTWSDGHKTRLHRIATHPRALLGPRRGAARPLATREPPTADAPTWSPRGDRLAFVTAAGDVVVASARTGHTRLIRIRSLRERAPSGLRIAFSPDGRQLAIVGWDAGTWVATLQDGLLHRIPTVGVRAYDLAWGPDSAHVVFMRGDRRGNGQLVVGSLDSERPSPLTNDVPTDPFAHFANTDPVWAPDGKHVAFLSNRDGADDRELFVIGADGRGERRLTRRGFLSSPVRWSPDSRRIAFVTGASRGRSQVSVVEVATGARRRVAVPREALDWSAGLALGWSGPRSAQSPISLPAFVAPHRIVVVRDHAPVGRARLTGVHRVARLTQRVAWEHVTAVSPDGSLAAFVRTTASEDFAVGVIALATGARRFVARGSSPSPSATAPVFTRDGRALEFRSRAGLITVSLRTGRRHVRTVDESRFPSPAGGAALEALARDRTVLHDASGRVRRLPAGFVPQRGSWAPNGRFFALVRHASGYDRAQVVLFDARGNHIGRLLGIRERSAEWYSLSWSTDGRWLLVTPGYGGSRPPTPPLYAYSVANGRMSKVLREASAAVAGPRDLVIYERGVGTPTAALWAGRIATERLLPSRH